MGSVTLTCSLMLLCFGAINAYYEVAFSAARSGYQGSGRIAYNYVYMNYGRAYHSNGIFYTPSTGLYSFTYNFLTYPHKSVCVYLYQNNAIKARSYAYNRYGYANGGNSAVLWLHRGDRVWTRCVNYIYGGYYTTFSGFKISSYWGKDQTEQALPEMKDQTEQDLSEMKDQSTMDLADEPEVDDNMELEN